MALKKNKVQGSCWAVPTPLVRPPEPSPEYPTDALGSVLGPATLAIADHTQVPPAMAANSVLATAALATQAHANVETLGDPAPISLYLLTIAESGARKTSADRRALVPVTRHVQTLEEARLSRADDAQQSSEPFRLPWVLCSEPTAEGLFRSLQFGEFSQGVFSNEGGSFIGGHALSDESRLRSIAMLSRAWDGAPLDRVRGKDAEHTTLYGRRLSVHLMAQPDVAQRLVGDPLYKDQGFLARVLIAQPPSLAGSRLHDGAARSFDLDPRFRAYRTRITELLQLAPSLHPDLEGLAPSRLRLSQSARERVVKFYNWIEQAPGPSEEFEFHREWAGKAAEHACRIAGVLTLVGSSTEMVKTDEMSRGITLAKFYAREYVRLVGAASVSQEIRDAQLLLEWIKSKSQAHFRARRVVQYGPYRLRSADRCSQALNILVEHGWLQGGRNNEYSANPSLWR